MKKWSRLQPGDQIDIVAPGYPFEKEVLDGAIRFLMDRGYKPNVVGEILKPQSFHAHSDQVRFRNLKTALLSKRSKAVWCLRGGYGSNRLLPLLAKVASPAQSKIFIGISDVTSLHLFLNQKWGWTTLHGTLLDRLANKSLPLHLVEETFSVLSGAVTRMLFPGLRALNAKARKIVKVNGSVVGGNLTTLQAHLGTPFGVQLRNRFLFIEDFGERGYRVDRMLEHFKQAGCFKGCKGVLVGHFIGGLEPDTAGALAKVSRVAEALDRFAHENPEIPVWDGVESGHGEFLRVLPFGSQASVQQDKSGIRLQVATGVQE